MKKEDSDQDQDKKIPIPQRLQNPNFRFCKVKINSKQPIGEKWQNTNNFRFDDTELLKHIEKNKNFGIVGGFGGLCIVDGDTDEIIKIMEEKLPETFTVKTGSSTPHFYYICKGLNGKIVLKDKEKKHQGEILGKGSFAMCAGSVHPETREIYKVEKDIEIKEITLEELFGIFEGYLPHFEENLEEIDKYSSADTGILIKDVIDLKNFTKRGNQYYGSHPIHGSETGMNFWVNPKKNIWHCFRCDSGGEAMSLIAVMEKIIDCSEAKKKVLVGKKFIEVLEKAKRKYEYKFMKGAGMDIFDVNIFQYNPNCDVIDEHLVYGQKMLVKGILDARYLDTYIFDDNEIIFSNEDLKLNYNKKTIRFGSPLWFEKNQLSNEGIKKLQGFFAINKTTSKLLDGLVLKIKEYVDLNNENEYYLVACWAIHTYLINLFGNTVYLWLVGDEGTGKSTLLKVLEKLCFKARYIGGSSVAAAQRRAAISQTTMLTDEFDKWNKEAIIEIQGSFNVGYQRGGVVEKVINNKLTGKFEVEGLPQFSAKVVATNKDNLINTFKNRCIPIVTSKTGKKLKNINLLNEYEEQAFDDLRSEIYYFCLKNWSIILNNYKEFVSTSELLGRELELFSPLRAIARVFSKEDIIQLGFLENREEQKDGLGFERPLTLYQTIFDVIKSKNKTQYDFELGELLNSFNDNLTCEEEFKSKSKVKFGLMLKKLRLNGEKHEVYDTTGEKTIRRTLYLIDLLTLKERVKVDSYDDLYDEINDYLKKNKKIPTVTYNHINSINTVNPIKNNEVNKVNEVNGVIGNGRSEIKNFLLSQIDSRSEFDEYELYTTTKHHLNISEAEFFSLLDKLEKQQKVHRTSGKVMSL